MGAIQFATTEKDYSIETRDDETILETFRRLNIPLQGSLIVDADRKPVSITAILQPHETVYAYSLRNPDFDAINPEYTLIKRDNLSTELIRPLTNPADLAIVQYTREEAFDYIYSSFETVVDHALEELGGTGSPLLQVSMSSGGDSRVLAECIQRHMREKGTCDYHCISIANGFEDEYDLLTNAAKIAQEFGLNHTSYDIRTGAEKLGYNKDFNEIIEEYSTTHDRDELEVLGTYWLQEINKQVAAETGAAALVFGYNQEDVIAEKLYQLMLDMRLPNYPVRDMNGLKIIAPLAQVPKRMLDSMDIDNSLRNYGIRVPSVSYLRSSLYFMAYTICEQFPALADIFSGAALAADDPDHILDWLNANAKAAAAPTAAGAGPS
ncbi:hypothetical protein JM93_00970 [Roseibium hamelinense]|uniref:Asparagine synthase n=1 Tax=Roseibium hamelinense TaxID=150831 RepID=A0A562TIY0_9HYPH|nr:hypothetical protein [Roseibium hamelinense]MTI42767.1 hypothetical protein [Roseibium hamelinense]TWI93413.1 hypothetical protein JM93_00970 [Roseibium hamelinense]